MDVSTLGQKAKELANAVLRLFSMGDPNSRYLLLLELSIVYGLKLLRYQEVLATSADDSGVKRPFSFRWKSRWLEQFEFLIHVQSSVGKRLGKVLRGDTRQGLALAHFPFPSRETVKDYYRELIPHPISVKTCNTLKAEVARRMTDPETTEMEPLVRHNFGLAADAVDIATYMDFIEDNVIGFKDDTKIEQFLSLSLQTAIDSIATHAMQFYLISPNGALLMPIHTFPFRECSEAQLITWIKQIQSELPNVGISWVSTDGDLAGLECALADESLLLFRDHEHVAKCGRNAIIDETINYPGGPLVRLSDLEMLQQSSPDIPIDISATLCKLLKYHHAKPSSWDKLRLDPVKRLVEPGLVRFLSEFPETHAVAPKMRSLGRYLMLLNCVLYLWNDDSKVSTSSLTSHTCFGRILIDCAS